MEAIASVHLINLSIEHGHSHSHSHTASPAASQTSSSAASTHSVENTVRGDTTPTTKQPILTRGRSTSRSRPSHSHVHSPSDSFSSLYGHPAATRASLLQTANEIASARSPSPPRHSGSYTHRLSFDSSVTSSSIVPQATPVTPGATMGSPVEFSSEGTPLLHDPHEHSPELHGHDGAHNHGHSHGSMNMRALLLHVLGDALGNVGVIATGLIIWLTTWSYKYYCDPVISLVITVIIFSSALPLGTSSQRLSRLDFFPSF